MSDLVVTCGQTLDGSYCEEPATCRGCFHCGAHCVCLPPGQVLLEGMAQRLERIESKLDRLWTQLHGRL